MRAPPMLKLETLSERLQLTLPESQDVLGERAWLPRFTQDILCCTLPVNTLRPVEKGFKIVRDGSAP